MRQLAAPILGRLRDAYVRHGFDVVITESSPLSPFTPAKGVARVCIAGGDGTVRHVLENAELRAVGAAIDTYPAGTINLIAREWKDPPQPDKFVLAAIERSTPSSTRPPRSPVA